MGVGGCGGSEKKLQTLSIYNADAVCVTEEAFKECVCVCVDAAVCLMKDL